MDIDNKKNTSEKEDLAFDKKGYKISIKEGEIMRITVSKYWGKIEIVKDLMEEIRRYWIDKKDKARVLVDLGLAPNIPSSLYRKSIVTLVKDTIKEIGFNKVAMYRGALVQGTVASFIIRAIGLRKIKYFKTEEEALKWLKED